MSTQLTPESPCPFCGSRQAIVFMPEDNEYGPHVVFCGVCEAEGPPANSPEQAIEQWEQRA